jgi:hypothetical protein
MCRKNGDSEGILKASNKRVKFNEIDAMMYVPKRNRRTGMHRHVPVL